MFDRYTTRARRVIHRSVYVAGRTGSPQIETEHLLLGLLGEDKGLARRFLGSPWAAEVVCRRIEQNKPVREKVPGSREIPLCGAVKRALAFAAEEADLLSSKRIRTEHLLLGLLREDNCFAAEILSEHAVYLVAIRDELMSIPHDDSVRETFVRERGPLPEDVVELQARVKSIMTRMENAIADGDFDKAHMYSREEGEERDKLYLLYRKYGFSDWLYD